MNPLARCFLLSAVVFGPACTKVHEPPSPPKPIAPSWFEGMNGVFAETQAIDVNPEAGDKLVYRFEPIADSGVELDLVHNGSIVWRAHVQPLMVEHSRYRQIVTVKLVPGDQKHFQVVSIGAKTIRETRRLSDGSQVSRIVEKNEK